LNAYLKTVYLDNRKDSWIYDGLGHAMMKYIEENHPIRRCWAAPLLIVESYNLTNLDFNEQYSYFYMLMARKTWISPWETLKIP
jgi:hypothetical protein